MGVGGLSADAPSGGAAGESKLDKIGFDVGVTVWKSRAK